ncbi:hypothetical protein DPMN_001798 [Dreissena polymorpha]|uniref:Uncharacterized protein n=1 Tax=Dreissena polymorpha TaxID=45954 RepID=A0A9D4RT95_DREPO|nr:hypothetical protein DPMN_001798 [Dreissena polymorpha]
MEHLDPTDSRKRASSTASQRTMRSLTGAELSAWMRQLDRQQAELYLRTTMRSPTDADLSAWRTQLDRQQEELDLEISCLTDVISSGLRRPALTPSIKRGRPDVDGSKSAISVLNPAVRLQFEGPTRFRTSSPKSEMKISTSLPIEKDVPIKK